MRVGVCRKVPVGRMSVVLSALLWLGLSAGCSHPCGYVGLRTWQVPLGGEEDVRLIPCGQPLRVLEDLSETNARLEVRVEQREVRLGLVRQETYGHPAAARWKWYAPLVKPIVSATVVLPFCFSWRDPHCHSAENWRLRDYLRDVVAWYNWASAVPTGPRELGSEERLVRVRETNAPLSDCMVGIPGRTVELYLGGARIDTQTTDAAGCVQFDVTKYLTPEFAGEDRRIRLVSPRPDGEPAEIAWVLPGRMLRGLLRTRERAAGTAE